MLSSCHLKSQLQARCGLHCCSWSPQLLVRCAGTSGGAVTVEGLSSHDNSEVVHLCPLFVFQCWLVLPTCRMFTWLLPSV